MSTAEEARRETLTPLLTEALTTWTPETTDEDDNSPSVTSNNNFVFPVATTTFHQTTTFLALYPQLVEANLLEVAPTGSAGGDSLEKGEGDSKPITNPPSHFLLKCHYRFIFVLGSMLLLVLQLAATVGFFSQYLFPGCSLYGVAEEGCPAGLYCMPLNQSAAATRYQMLVGQSGTTGLRAHEKG